MQQGAPFSFKTLAPFNQEGINSIKQWIPARGLAMQGDIDSMAYAISVGIKKKGIEPKNITENVLVGKTDLENKIARSIELSLGTAVEITIFNMIKA